MDDGTEFNVQAGDVFDIPPGHDNWILGEEPAVSIVWGGWHGFGKPSIGERVLTTLLMTDVVGSTDTLIAVGDSVWRHLLDRHNATFRDVLDRYRGQEVNMTGDGFLAMFDGAARAVAAAKQLAPALRDVGFAVRIGVYTGEVELVPGGVRGMTVHETARIMALGGAGDIVVSDVTRMLSIGSGIRYDDFGVHRLKGLPEPRQVYQVAGNAT